MENNYSGQFHRYLRSETGFTVDGHIRKYGRRALRSPPRRGGSPGAAGPANTDIYVPYQEVVT